MQKNIAKLLVVFGLFSFICFGGDKVQMSFAGQTFIVDMDDNATSREFINKLPLELDFVDYVGKEKVSKLSLPLPKGESSGYIPDVGDLFYFTPWENIGIFYEKQPPHSGLVFLGRLEEKGVKEIKNMTKDFKIKILKD